jgi:hypothetical protein
MRVITRDGQEKLYFGVAFHDGQSGDGQSGDGQGSRGGSGG